MNKPGFNQRLRALEPWQRQAFVAALAEHALPNYQLFAEVVDWGKPDLFVKALDKAWNIIIHRQGKKPLENLLDKLEAITPDPDQFDMYGVYPAIDAAVTVSGVLESILGDDPEIVLSLSKLSRQTVAEFIRETEGQALTDDALRDVLRSHPLMENEFDWQSELLARLEQCRREPGPIEAIRQWSRQQGISNIGISLDA